MVECPRFNPFYKKKRRKMKLHFKTVSRKLFTEIVFFLGNRK